MSTPGSVLFGQASSLPEHMAVAAAASRRLRGLPRRSEVDAVLILGMGSARTAGHAVCAVARPAAPIPIQVESAYDPPAWVGARTLVFALSGSGNTDEVHHAAAAAARRGGRIAIVAAGGWLAEFAEESGAPLVRIPPSVAPARATFGVHVAAMLSMLDEMGLLPGATAAIDAAIGHLRRRRDRLRAEGGPASSLADLLAGRHVSLQGDSPIGVVAAERWKAQINQNARQPASFSQQPNASHHEVVGWDFHSPAIPRSEAVVLLRHGLEDPRVSRRLDLLAGYLQGKVPVHSVTAEGSHPLTAMMDLVMLGDFTSLYMAERNGVDSSAVPFISETLKEGLAPPARPETARQTDGEF